MSNREGSIELVVGTMFGGKTEELILRLNEAETRGGKVQVYKPVLDTRYHVTRITSHSGAWLDAKAVHSSFALEADVRSDINVIGIDEGQFFDDNLPFVVTKLADRGLRVIIAALDTDYLRRPFGCVPNLLAIATSVNKLHAFCLRCKTNNVLRRAAFSHRVISSADIAVVGGAESYEPLCRSCYLVLNKIT